MDADRPSDSKDVKPPAETTAEESFNSPPTDTEPSSSLEQEHSSSLDQEHSSSLDQEHSSENPTSTEQEPLQKNNFNEPMHRNIIAIIIIAIIIIALLYFILGWFKPKNKEAPPVPVKVTKVRQVNMPVFISALGSVTPLDTVNVKTQINGQLMRVYFKEGQDVQVGDLLAEIDQRPLLAQLYELEGQLLRDQALLENARIDLKRYQELYPVGAVSQQVLATQESLVRQYEGTVQLDKGQIEVIKVNLGYCKIQSPINGRVGLRLVDPGNFVQTSDTTALFVLNTLNPITVLFTIPEDFLPEVIANRNAGKTFLVKAYDRSQTKFLENGSLMAIDNQIDPTTGTVKIRAIFNNPNDKLYANQFVNVNLRVKTLKNALTVPTAAIQRGSKGTFVFVVNNDNIVSIVPVKVLSAYKNFSAVSGELKPNQIIVIEGTDKIKECTKVQITKRKANKKIINNNTTTCAVSKEKKGKEQNIDEKKQNPEGKQPSNPTLYQKIKQYIGVKT